MTVPSVYRWTASDLVAEGICTPQCLLAVEDGFAWTGCQCRCNVVLHGALAEEVIVRRGLVQWFADAAASEGKPDPLAAFIERGGDPRLVTPGGADDVDRAEAT